MGGSRKIYLVQREYGEYDFSGLVPEDFRCLPPLSDSDAAEECCERYVRELRARLNPFEYRWRLDRCTSMPPGVLRDWVLDLGLEPPPSDDDVHLTPAWSEWWQNNAPAMTERQRSRIWQVMDRVRLYTVAEIDLPD